MDHSESYKTKIRDLGNNRTAIYRYKKSKYVLKEDITNIDGGNFIVREGRKGKESFYRLHIYSGFCECSKGKNCGPCNHNNSVAKHFKVSGLSVIPESDTHMRVMWHFIAFGQTLGNHWYRGLKDGKETVINVE